MTTAMGRSVCEPATPTSGAAAAPIANWARPITPDALPASWACRSGPSATALGSTSPVLARHEQRGQDHRQAQPGEGGGEQRDAAGRRARQPGPQQRPQRDPADEPARCLARAMASHSADATAQTAAPASSGRRRAGPG
jgi:hypothetical protein